MKVVSFILSGLRHAKAQFIAYLFAVVFGAISAAVLFYFTSPPTSSLEVRAKISDLARESVRSELRVEIKHIALDYFSYESLDLSASNSVFVFGTVTTENNDIFRFLGVFQPSAPGLLDRIVGRPGFLRATYVAVIPAIDELDVVASNVDFKDIDLDGNKEIFVTVKSTRADNIPTGLIILKKDSNDVWNVLSMPSVDQSLKTLIASRGLAPSLRGDSSKIWFDAQGQTEHVAARERENYRRFEVSEELIDVMHSGKTTTLPMLQNGGRFELFTNPETGYPQLGVVASINDDEGVVENHHVMVAFFRIEERQVEVDPAWNWGRPMLSVDTEDIDGIDLKDFQAMGIGSHTIDGIYFSPSGFRRSIPSN